MEKYPCLASYWNDENEMLKKTMDNLILEVCDEKITNEIDLCEKSLSPVARDQQLTRIDELKGIYNYLQNHFQLTHEMEGYYYEDPLGKAGWIYLRDLPKRFNWSQIHLKVDSKSKYEAVRYEERLVRSMLSDKKKEVFQIAQNSYKEEKDRDFLGKFESMFDLLPRKIIFSLGRKELVVFIKKIYKSCEFAKIDGKLIIDNITKNFNDSKKVLSNFEDWFNDSFIRSDIIPKRFISSNPEELNLILYWYKGIVLQSFFRGFYFKKFNVNNLKILSSQMLENIFAKIKDKILNVEYLFISKSENIEINDTLINEFCFDESYREVYIQSTHYENIQNYKKSAQSYYKAGKIATEEANTWKNIAFDMDNDECRQTIMNLSSVFYNKANNFFTQSFVNVCIFLASKGDVLGIAQLAKCYLQGTGNLPENDEKAVQLFIKAAKHGDRFSMYELGKCYFEGVGVEKNVTEAFKWFEAMLEKSKLYFSMPLAYRYEKALGIPQYNEKAIDLYIAEKPEIICQLAEHYLKGIGVEKDKLKATQLYIKSAKIGFPDAMRVLGKLYAEEENNFIKLEIEQFFAFSQDKSSKGDIRDNYRLGLCFELGIGTKQDLSEAILLYWEASQEEGIIHILAESRLEELEEKRIRCNDVEVDKLYMMGWRYLCGIDSIEDHKMAAMYFLQAAEKGFAPAMYQFAQLCEIGKGMVKDEGLAMEWYQKAAEKHYSSAVRKLKNYNDSLNKKKDKDDSKNLVFVNCDDKLLIELEERAKLEKTKVMALKLQMVKHFRMVGKNTKSKPLLKKF